MADRFPLIANTSANQIQELSASDNLDLTGNSIIGVSTIGVSTVTATSSTVGSAVTMSESGIDVTGIVTSTSFSGSASNLTSIPAANIVGLATAGFERTGGFGGGAYEFVSKTTISSSTSYVDYTLDQDSIYKIWCTRATRTSNNNSYPMIQLFTNGSSSVDTSSQHTTEFHNRRSGGSYRSGVNDMEIDAGQYGNNMYYELDVSTYLYGWVKVHGSLLRNSSNSQGDYTDCRFDAYCQHDDYANKYISGLRLYVRFGNMDAGTQFLVYKLKQS